MKTMPKSTIAKLIAAIGLLAVTFCGNAQNDKPANPQQQAAQLREKWSKALGDALHDLRTNDDQESASFVSGMLMSLNQPGGMSPAALDANGQLLENRVRELVRHGALESGAILNSAQGLVLNHSRPNPSNGPAHPHLKTGGLPGPGGLVLYLPFDKPDKDGFIHDESGAGNDGHVFGAKWVADGKIGGAYHFSITNLTDRIVITNSDTLNLDYITISAWIKTVDKDGFWNRIADKHCNNGYCLDTEGDYHGNHRGKLQFEIGLGYLEQPNHLLDDNQWHHVAGTFDGTTMRCYLDGVATEMKVKNPGPLRKNGWDLCIGNSVIDYEWGDEFLAFDGLIDEVRIYNRALSADEIKLLVNATRAGADVVPPPPFAGKIGYALTMARERNIYVIPTHETNAAAQKAVQDNVQWVRNRFGPNAPIITDDEALNRNLSNNIVIAYGTLAGNAWLAKNAGLLPVKMEPDGLTTGKKFTGQHLRFIAAWPNPQNPAGAVIIYTAQQAGDIVNINSVFHGPTDFVVADGTNILQAADFDKAGGVWTFPATAQKPDSSEPAKPDAAERLKKVKSLYDQGLINKEDYDKKVKEIMDAL
jgi:hypothetical protein